MELLVKFKSICIGIMRLSLLGIRIRAIVVVIIRYPYMR